MKYIIILSLCITTILSEITKERKTELSYIALNTVLLRISYRSRLVNSELRLDLNENFNEISTARILTQDQNHKNKESLMKEYLKYYEEVNKYKTSTNNQEEREYINDAIQFFDAYYLRLLSSGRIRNLPYYIYNEESNSIDVFCSAIEMFLSNWFGNSDPQPSTSSGRFRTSNSRESSIDIVLISRDYDNIDTDSSPEDNEEDILLIEKIKKENKEKKEKLEKLNEERKINKEVNLKLFIPSIKNSKNARDSRNNFIPPLGQAPKKLVLVNSKEDKNINNWSEHHTVPNDILLKFSKVYYNILNECIDNMLSNKNGIKFYIGLYEYLKQLSFKRLSTIKLLKAEKIFKEHENEPTLSGDKRGKYFSADGAMSPQNYSNYLKSIIFMNPGNLIIGPKLVEGKKELIGKYLDEYKGMDPGNSFNYAARGIVNNDYDFAILERTDIDMRNIIEKLTKLNANPRDLCDSILLIEMKIILDRYLDACDRINNGTVWPWALPFDSNYPGWEFRDYHYINKKNEEKTSKDPGWFLIQTQTTPLPVIRSSEELTREHLMLDRTNIIERFNNEIVLPFCINILSQFLPYILRIFGHNRPKRFITFSIEKKQKQDIINYIEYQILRNYSSNISTNYFKEISNPNNTLILPRSYIEKLMNEDKLDYNETCDKFKDKYAQDHKCDILLKEGRSCWLLDEDTPRCNWIFPKSCDSEHLATKLIYWDNYETTFPDFNNNIYQNIQNEYLNNGGIPKDFKIVDYISSKLQDPNTTSVVKLITRSLCWGSKETIKEAPSPYVYYRDKQVIICSKVENRFLWWKWYDKKLKCDTRAWDTSNRFEIIYPDKTTTTTEKQNIHSGF